MFGVKINEFDNSLGTIEDFNKIFPMTQLEGRGNVEILDIVDSDNYSGNVYLRNIEVNGNLIEHDFGSGNFINNEDFQIEDNIRFKYYAKDLEGNLIATAYNCPKLAEKLGVSVSMIKNRLVKPVDENSNTKSMFNVTRKEI